MFNILQRKKTRFIKKVATAQGFAGIGGGIEWADGMGWDGDYLASTQH
jgi:hypothetical protein